MLEINSTKAFFRDGFVPFGEANVSVASSPVLYGLSIYTVFSANWNYKQQKLYIFRLREHYDRLVNSAKIMDFDSFAKEWPYERFQKTMLELLNLNNVRESALVRVTVFIDELIAGTRIHGLKNSLCAYVYPMGEILPTGGANVCVSSWTRNPDNAIPSRAKVNGSYVNASLMKNEALLNGYDDAIAIDEHGHVAEGTVANLFFVRGGVLTTPGPATDILEGITRSSILTIAKDLNIPTQERSIDRSELYIAEEAFMCGSSARVTPVLSIDKRPVGAGKIGEITAKLDEAYSSAQIGNTDSYRKWLTAINP
jgi:branched-chain amino acid aminotransferase